MATIGLDKLFYSKITEGENGDETYATPVALAKAMTAELSVELAEATLYGSVRRTAARRKRRAFTSTAPPGIPSIR